MKYKTSLLLNHKNTNISTCQAQSFHCQQKSLSICTDNQKAGFCIMAKLDWKINVVLNMAYIPTMRLSLMSWFLQTTSLSNEKAKNVVQYSLAFLQIHFPVLLFLYNQLHLTSFIMFCWNVCPVWSFLPCPSWFDKYTLVSRSLFLIIHWQRALQ